MDLTKHAFFEGKTVPLSEARISIATHGFLYGTAVFGGMRAYWNEEKQRLFVFRPYDHFHRLLNSGKMMAMSVPYDEEGLTELTVDLLRTDNWRRDVYLRPTIYKADMGIGVRLHELKDEFCMFVMAYEPYVKNDTNAHVTVSSWRRIDDNVIPARGKVAGAYANSALIKTDANRAGFDEALVLDQNGHISEGSAMNIFMAREGVLITPPVTDNILEGITRRSVIEVARKELGLDVVERSIDRTEVYMADELFMTGTAAQVVAVTKVDHRPVGGGSMGPITTKLRAAYEDIVRGKNPRFANWNVEV
ncbi:MAG: branched chain amino acid aminotransferase [Chloroflexi bacterium]|nr:branched-chain amino acid transaminase [Anaerolineales bacterium]RIK53534.1 MAG: branched chain amino acid aminotransferase [Chloroflexota bacterium]